MIFRHHIPIITTAAAVHGRAMFIPFRFSLNVQGVLYYSFPPFLNAGMTTLGRSSTGMWMTEPVRYRNAPVMDWDAGFLILIPAALASMPLPTLHYMHNIKNL